MPACDCGTPKGKHLNGCSSLDTRIDASITGKVKKALKDENTGNLAKNAEAITGRGLKALSQATKKRIKEEQKKKS